MPPAFVAAPCGFEGCSNTAEKRGWCNTHYRRWLLHGDPATMNRVPPGEARDYFEANVMVETAGCKEWPYTHDAHGYGKLYYDGAMRPVHMLACIRWHGPKLPGMQAAHGDCHDPGCWAGHHVSWKTAVDNAADRWRDGTHHGGARANGAKLSDQDVLTIRDRLRDGESRSVMASEYGVHYTNICQIATGRTWKHLLP